MNATNQTQPEKNIEILSASLSTGTIQVEVDRALLPATDLFAFAERRNPKRSFLFVSKVLGRHIPARPQAMRQVMEMLTAQIPADLPRPVLVVGLAETAVALGAGVHRAYSDGSDDIIFISTTRHEMARDLMCEFREEHSHAAVHYIYQPFDARLKTMVSGARSLVLVDDEMSTGNTFVNLASALQKQISSVERIVLATITDWSDGAAVQRIGPHASAVSVLSGRYTWTPNPNAILPEMLVAGFSAQNPSYIDPSSDWGRGGVTSHVSALGGSITAETNEKILVLGTGEYVWHPFLLAEELENSGANVHFSAVTRSPIAIGHSISRACAFSDNYGLGVANFLYNVSLDAHDRIVLCAETQPGSVDPILADAIRPTVIYRGARL